MKIVQDANLSYSTNSNSNSNSKTIYRSRSNPRSRSRSHHKNSIKAKINSEVNSEKEKRSRGKVNSEAMYSSSANVPDSLIAFTNEIHMVSNDNDNDNRRKCMENDFVGMEEGGRRSNEIRRKQNWRKQSLY